MENEMPITYHVVPHEDGWAYRLDDVFSETFPTHDVALRAARSAAERHEASDEDRLISYQTADSSWHDEVAAGGDRPETEIDDSAAPARKST
jgi:hypothetical protein